jgi:peptide/nickel transport system permease protein
MKKTDIIGAKEQYYSASQWSLVRGKFLKNRMAAIGFWFLMFLFLISIFAEFIAPYPPSAGTKEGKDRKYTYGPPQIVHIFDQDGLTRPYVEDRQTKYSVTAGEMQRKYRVEGTKKYKVLDKFKEDETIGTLSLSFFVHGSSYRLFGLLPTDIHLFGATDPKRKVHLFGTDKFGTDLFSQCLYATRTSLSIGAIGVFIAFFMALLIGGTSGYVGGYTDVGIQGASDTIRMIPTIPLYAAFAATFPKEWSNVQIYFALTSILGLLGWTTLARRIRTHVLATRNDDYILSSKISGASGAWIIRRHLLPSFTSYIIVDLIISFPYIVLSETALSLIGLGLRRPTISWGVLMQDMTTLQAIQLTPWYFIPLIFFSLAILGFVLVGDGLRQAADPYSQMKR